MRRPHSEAAVRLVMAGAITLLVTVPPAAASAAGTAAPVLPSDPVGRTDCIAPGEVFAPRPWPQRIWDLPAAWALSRGGGVTVAVLSSGVDGRQVQLAGHVDRGRSALPDAPSGAPGDQDCTGVGTGLASLVVAQPVPGVGLRGVAPDADILPIAVGDTTWFDADPDSDPAAPQRVADGIRASVDAGADIVLVGGYLATDSPDLSDAVESAVASGVLVVAPVRDGDAQFTGPAYPAAYRGVLGVTAVDEQRAVVDGTETGESVDLAAPGENLAGAARGSGHSVVDGTPGAAALVAATAALVLSSEPDLSPAELSDRLRATAGPVADEDPTHVGAGLLDPVRAITEHAAPSDLVGATPAGLAPRDASAVAAELARVDRSRLVTTSAAATVVIAAALGLVVGTLRRGRRTGWGVRTSRTRSAPPGPATPGRRTLFRAPD